MTEYNNHLYSFLTLPENFEPFADLIAQYEQVRSRLILDFWQRVYEKVEHQKPVNSPWSFSLDDASQPNRKLRSHHPDLAGSTTRAKIVFEGLDGLVILGMWVDRSRLSNQVMNDICHAAKEQVKDKAPWEAGNPNEYFVISKKPGLQLRQKASLMDILPANRERLAEAYARDFLDAVELFGPFCLEQAKKYQ